MSFKLFKVLSVVIVCAATTTANIANAGLITVIGDVDAINTSGRPGNFSLLENIRGGATDILWLTGGGNFTGRDTNLRAQWGVTADTSSSVTASFNNRELVVVSAEWANNFGFDGTSTSAISSYLNSGGNMLFVGQLCQGCNGFDPLNLYNNFLTSVGATIQYDGGFVNGGNYTPDQTTSIGAGAGSFQLSGVNSLIGGVSVVEDTNGRVGVAFETATAVSAPTTLALLSLGLFGIAWKRRNQK
jgi:hypothetical protein